MISNRLLHLANESGTPTDEEDTPNANGSSSGHDGPTGQSPLLFEVVDSNENGSGKAFSGPPRQARFGPCLDFGFQYALIRNNQSKNFGVEYWTLPGSNLPWRP